MTSASGSVVAGGDRGAPKGWVAGRSEPWASSPPKCTALPSDLSRQPRATRLSAPTTRLARNQVWLTRWLRSLSAVPELTRGIDIKPNARLSLRGHRNPIGSSHRTRSPFGSAIQAIIPPLGALSPRDCRWSQAVRILNKMRVRGRGRPGWAFGTFGRSSSLAACRTEGVRRRFWGF